MGKVDTWFRATNAGGSSSVGLSCPFPFGTALFAYGVSVRGRRGGVLGQCGGPALSAQSLPKRAGVVGTSRDEAGVRGTSSHNIGVWGVSEYPGGGFHPNPPSPWVPPPQAAVFGATGGLGSKRPGVVGYSRHDDGLQGASFTGTAIRALSEYDDPIIRAGNGVYGLSGTLTGVTGVCGTEGSTIGNVATIAGVVGTSDQRAGVIGTSTGNPGVIGVSNKVGVFGHTTNPASYAGYFAGNVTVDRTYVSEGRLTASVKNAVVAFPDGSKRLLHCMESPEHWLEDFGAAKLKRGRAVVRLDTDFAKIVAPDDYRVFLMPEGDCNGLYVRRKSAKGFEVREVDGGTSSVSFSYSIVARRKDIKAHRRFAKVDTRLPLSAAVTRPMRKPARSAAELRAFLHRLEKEARAPKRVKKSRTSRSLGRHLRPRTMHVD
jgi:hypothetical protein